MQMFSTNAHKAKVSIDSVHVFVYCVMDDCEWAVLIDDPGRIVCNWNDQADACKLENNHNSQSIEKKLKKCNIVTSVVK